MDLRDSLPKPDPKRGITFRSNGRDSSSAALVVSGCRARSTWLLQLATQVAVDPLAVRVVVVVVVLLVGQEVEVDW